ncbi:MAG: hypothetical protein Q8880_09525, partial [Bacteroidota bacterium]|nr:hypothetical protein [Bacteroidota bacterium]
MKIKLLLTIILSLNSLFINAQRVIEKTNLTTSEHKRTNIDINNINKNFIHMSNLKTNENRIHAAYNPYINYYNNLSGNVYYYIEPLFYDSLAVSYFNVNNQPTAYKAFVMGIGSVIDPTSSLFDQSNHIDNQGNSLPNLQLYKNEKYT